MDKADCIALMGYRIIWQSLFRYLVGVLHGELYVQAYTKVGKRFLNCKKNPRFE
jgi:hypothetical protein